MRNMFATHTDYAEFKGLITANPAFVPSNVDGIAERNGHFLIMEWKTTWRKSKRRPKAFIAGISSYP